MKDMVSKIRELIQPLFDEEYLHLVDLELHGGVGNRVLKIYADTEQGITLREITQLTRQIRDLLDMSDVLEGRYRLEVSSPGIDHPLERTWEFRKNLGRMLRVIYFSGEEETREVVGTLSGVDAERIILTGENREITIPRNQIKKAKVYLKW